VNITRHQSDNIFAMQIACAVSCGQAGRPNNNALNNNSLNIGRVGV
jgi:hypothetical protein